MSSILRYRLVSALFVYAFLTLSLAASGQQPIQKVSSANEIKGVDEDELSVEEICSLLQSIPPYLPEADITGEVDVFGSTSMDSMAHHWATVFKQFHPKANVKISAAGTESVFERLGKNPKSIGMMSRPVSKEDLDRLKTLGLKKPVAIQVARDALGVFVHESNPMDTISYQQLVQLYCSDEKAGKTNWDTLEEFKDWKGKPVHLIGRDKASGTRTFIERYLFHKFKVGKYENELKTNVEVVKAVGKDPLAIALGEFKTQAKGVKKLKLREKKEIIEGNDHEILLGKYPVTRPLTLVFDFAEHDQRVSNREFIRLVLSREGQTKAILAGFFPYDPPTLRAQLSRIGVPVKRN